MTEGTRVICRTPTKGRDGLTRIPKWKYECIQAAIFDVLKDADDGRVQFKDLTELVTARLTKDQLANLGSAGWHVTTVKLNMEVESDLMRISGAKPQTLQKAD